MTTSTFVKWVFSQLYQFGSRQNIISAIKSIPCHHLSSVPTAIKNQASATATHWLQMPVSPRGALDCFNGFV